MKKFLKELAMIFAVILLLVIVINYSFGKNYYNHYELQYKEIVYPKKKDRRHYFRHFARDTWNKTRRAGFAWLWVL